MKTLLYYCRRHQRSLWGQPRMVTPRLVDWIHGDGLQLVALTPIMTRPNYYVCRIGSNVDLDNFGKNPPIFCDEVLDDLKDAIEEQYGVAHEEWEHDNRHTYHRRNYFPAASLEDGCDWGRLAILGKLDKRTERQVRLAIRRQIIRDRA